MIIVSYMICLGKGFIIADQCDVHHTNIGWHCSECVWIVPGTEMEE